MALPTADAARLALRTQQIIAHESGVINTVDPVGGSYAIEALTDEIEEQTLEYLTKSTVSAECCSAIESGWVQGQIQEAAYKYQRSIESKERIIVGVNEFRTDEEEPIPIHERIRNWKQRRLNRLDASAANANMAEPFALRWNDSRRRRAGTDENLMPHIFGSRRGLRLRSEKFRIFSARCMANFGRL